MNRNLFLLGLAAVLLGGALGYFFFNHQRSQVDEPPLVIGSNVWPGYEPLYLARALGYYDPNHIRLAELNSASSVISNLQNGMIQGAALTLDEQLTLMEKGYPVKAITILDISTGGDVILARPPFTTLASLKGKNIGLEDSALGAYMLARAMELAKVRVQDYKLKSYRINQHVEAYKNQEIDAVVTFEPVRSQLKALGAKEIFSSNQIPGEIVDVLILNEKVLQEQPARVQELLQGYYKARAYMQEHPQEAALILSKRLGVKPEEVWAQFEGLSLPSAQEAQQEFQNGNFEDTASRLAEVMIQQRILLPNAQLGRASTSQFLEQLQ